MVLFADCYPAIQDMYDVFAVDGKKYDRRGIQPASLGLFLRCTEHHIAIWRTYLGIEHREERVASMNTLAKLHEAYPDLCTIPAIVSELEEMTFRYITDAK